MQDLLKSLDQETVLGLCGMLVGVIAIIGGISVAITKVVSAHYRRTQLDEMEATLKMEMIQRGMSADEIAKVLGAQMGANRSSLSELLGGFPGFRMPEFGKKCEKVRTMTDIFSKLNGAEILGLCGIVLGLIAVVGGLALGFAALVAVYKRRVQLDEMEATLKMEMIQRGMSADEITRVLEAKIGATKRVSFAELFGGLKPPCKTAALATPCEKS